MTEYAFFTANADRWEKDMASLWGNLNICPHLYWLELPSHSQAELFSISSLKVWGNIQKPCYNIAYLLVRVDNTLKDRQYGISLVWVNFNQVRAATMEEAVQKLTAYPSSGRDWPYALAQLYEGPCHTPLPKDKHLGILPQGKAEETPCGWISQIKVCQLLAAGKQVVYPIGLNGHDEPIITTLPEPLDSGISLTTSKHIYLEIDIPSPPQGGTRPKDTTSWWGLHHPDDQSTQISPKIRRQYDYRGQQPPISSSAGSIQVWVQTLTPRGAHHISSPLDPTPEARGSTSGSQHLIPSKYWRGRSLPRGHPHQHLPNCCCFQKQKH